MREAERAGALISDLLTAARLDAGIDLDLAPISLRTLVQSEIDRVRLLHPEATVTMSGPEVIARADAAKVSSILRNVIDNAMRAAGPQGGACGGTRARSVRDRRNLGLWAWSPAIRARTDLRAAGTT